MCPRKIFRNSVPVIPAGAGIHLLSSGRAKWVTACAPGRRERIGQLFRSWIPGAWERSDRRLLSVSAANAPPVKHDSPARPSYRPQARQAVRRRCGPRPSRLSSALPRCRVSRAAIRYHYDVVRSEAIADDAQTVDARAEIHRAVFKRIVGFQRQHELLAEIGADRALVDQVVSRTSPPTSLMRAKRPGVKRPSLLSNTARPRIVPLCGSTWLSTKSRRPVCG